MKTTKFFTLIGIVLIGAAMISPAKAFEPSTRYPEKKAINIDVDRPILEFFASAYGNQIDARDIVRLQKALGQIDHVTVSFTDKDASDYVLRFKSLNEQGLEAWMFDEGYLGSAPKPETTIQPGTSPTYFANNIKSSHNQKKSIDLTVDKPLIEYVAKAYADQIDASDIVRLQKVMDKVDHVTVSFLDKDAADYTLRFRPLDQQGLEAWMFDQGFLDTDFQTDFYPMTPRIAASENQN
jgi:citrate lyase gamma subunit